MQKIVILENQTWDKTHFINHILLDLCKKYECSYEILEQIGNIKPEIIIQALSTCDTIMFTTTWLYQDSIHRLGKLLGSEHVAGKDIYYFGDDNVAHHLEEIFETKELAALAKHKFFTIGHGVIEEEDWRKEFDLQQYKTQWEKMEEERIKRNRGFEKTGRKVLIKELQAQGPQFAVLKKDTIVDELDCREIDPNPSIGVWVMGLDEPVKLLNNSRYEEWEYVEPGADALSLEFHKRGGRGEDTGSISILAEWINRCSSSLNLSDAELWLECDNICKLVGVERRGNRHYFERRLKEYREKHVYFRERRPRAI